jgi:hypothetical protein
MPVIDRCFAAGFTAYSLCKLPIFELKTPIANTGL